MFRKRMLAAFVLASISLLTVLPFSFSHGAAARGSGETEAVLDLIDVDLRNVPALGRLQAALGISTADARNIRTPFAQVGIDAITLNGETQGSQRVSSQDSQGSQNLQVPLSAPGINGSLSIAELLAVADADSAKAILGALTGELDIAALGLNASVGENGFKSVSGTFSSRSHVGVALGPVGLELGDILPTELLDALPLGVVLNLLDGFDINIPGQLSGQIDALRDVLATLDDIQAAISDLEALQSEADAIIATLPDVQAAQAAVDAAQVAVDAAEAEVAALEDEIEGVQTLLDACGGDPVDCDPLQDELDTLLLELEAAQATLDAALADLADAEADLQAALDAANDPILLSLLDQIDTLLGVLDGLLSDLEDLLGSLPNLDTLINNVVSLLQNAPLFDIGAIDVSVSAVADAVKGASAVTCSATGVNILGEQIGGVGCEGLLNALGEVRRELRQVLDSLPLAGALPVIELQGLKVKRSASGGPDANGVTRAAASLTAFHAGIPSVSLQNLTDTVLQQALADVQAILQTAGLDATLQNLLTQLQTQLQALPLGDALAGLRTVGVSIDLGRASVLSTFTARPGGGGGGGGRNPEDGAPLPFTGGTMPAALLAASALWLVAVGTCLALVTDRKFLLAVRRR